ncbi:hypothetical protein [Echinicola sediminis]
MWIGPSTSSGTTIDRLRDHLRQAQGLEGIVMILFDRGGRGGEGGRQEIEDWRGKRE